MRFDPQLRRAGAADAPAMAEVWLRSFGAALPTVRRAHSDDEVRGWIRDVVAPTMPAWVAVDGERIVALMVLHDGWLEQLYVDPEFAGRGVGSRLVELAKQQAPGGLQLWTFQVNAGARRFYERHGFRPVEFTDGAGNEEKEPDVRYVWSPS